jgi:hypothetical protein
LAHAGPDQAEYSCNPWRPSLRRAWTAQLPEFLVEDLPALRALQSADADGFIAERTPLRYRPWPRPLSPSLLSLLFILRGTLGNQGRLLCNPPKALIGSLLANDVQLDLQARGILFQPLVGGPQNEDGSRGHDGGERDAGNPRT